MKSENLVESGDFISLHIATILAPLQRRPLYRCSEQSGERKVRATQGTMLLNRKAGESLQ
jgi:hypothetical protein